MTRLTGLEWQSYTQPITLPLPDLSDEQRRHVLSMIEDRSNRAHLRVTCLLYHQPPVYLYGWRYCFDCVEWNLD